MAYVISSGECSSGLRLNEPITVLSGGTANSIVLDINGKLYVSSGGRANFYFDMN